MQTTFISTKATTSASAGDQPSYRRRLVRVQKVVHALDTAFRIPGTKIRLGWDSIIGMIPGIGDVSGALISTYVLVEARRLGVSQWTLARMSVNLLVDALLGSVPLIGDLFDVAFKANVRNLALLEKELNRR